MSVGNLNYWQRLWRIELLSIGALFVFSCAVAGVFLLETWLTRNETLAPLMAALLGGTYTFIAGFVPVTVLGAPAYCAYTLFDRFSTLMMLTVACLPGILMLFADPVFGVFGIVGGTSVFLTVDSFARRFSGW